MSSNKYIVVSGNSLFFTGKHVFNVIQVGYVGTAIRWLDKLSSGCFFNTQEQALAFLNKMEKYIIQHISLPRKVHIIAIPFLNGLPTKGKQTKVFTKTLNNN